MRNLCIAFLTLLVTYCSNAQSFEFEIGKWQNNYKLGFISDAHSPLSAADTSYVHFFPIDSLYSVVASIHVFSTPINVLFPTSGTKTKTFERYAQLDFVLNGQVCSLIVFQTNTTNDTNALFLPFVDASSGSTSYGGGRYIDLDKRTIENGKIEIDFNKAYNPYCAYATGYSCPLPPAENVLPIAIPVGERNYERVKKSNTATK